MGHIRFGRIFTVLTLILAVFPAFVSAMTWYVDPVNGNDSFTGDSPFARPEFEIGPKKTLDGVVSVANDYDMIVLMDGVYSGQQNGHPAIYSEIDRKHLYVCSANGAANCTIRIETQITFDGSSPTYLETCFDGITFTSATMSSYAAIHINNGSQIRFKDCVFTEFWSLDASTTVVLVYDASGVFENCTFTSNNTGGILNCEVNSTIELENSSFTDNHFNLGSPGPYGLVTVDESFVTVRGCSFSDNSSRSAAGAIFASNNASLQVQECVIENNTGVGGPFGIGFAGIFAEGRTWLFVSDTRVENQSCQYSTLLAAGLFAYHCEYVSVWNCKFNHNNTGMAVFAQPDSPTSVTVDNCEFVGNRAPDDYSGSIPGAGIFLAAGADCVNIRESTFISNQGGVYQTGTWIGDGRLQIDNCLFTDHQGPSAVIELSKPKTGCHPINNCTLADNYTYTLRAENTCVRNSILRSPSAPVDRGGLQFNYCNVENWTGSGVGNIDVDPLFAEPGYYHLDPQQRILGTDFHLKSTAGRLDPVQIMWVTDDVDSPCIDAGDPADVPFFEPTGSGGRVNMGVYGNTWQASMTDVCFGSGWRGSGMMFSDINKDCVVNLADYAVMASEWLDSTLAEAPVLY